MSDALTDALTHLTHFSYIIPYARTRARAHARYGLYGKCVSASVRQVRQPCIPSAMTDTLTRLVRLPSRGLRLVMG